MMKQMISVMVLLSGAAVCAADRELNVGDPAPKLAVKQFFKGEPVKSLEKGKIYVIEFWAINCPPCRAAIPHMTELQKKYPDVIFIGVDVAYFKEDKLEDIQPFVDKMGAKMDYRVAVDDLSEEQDATRLNKDKDWPLGIMQKTWMYAAGVYGIPMAFLVDGNGKIAWIGHPLDLDEPLEKITTGQWDLAAAAKKYKEQRVVDPKKRKLQEKLDKVEKSGDAKKVAASYDQAIADNPKRTAWLRERKWRTLVWMASDPKKADDRKNVVAVVDQAIAEDPKLERLFWGEKFRGLLRQADGIDQAVNYGKHLLETLFRADTWKSKQHCAIMTINLAYAVIGPNNAKTEVKADVKLVPLALQAALRADELVKGLDDDYLASNIADTLARAYFLSGDLSKAVATQERAVKLAMGTPLARNPGLKKRLQQYKEAAKKKDLSLSSAGDSRAVQVPEAERVAIPATGFQEEVQVTAPTRIDWQFVARVCGCDPDPDADRYDSRKQRYQLYVPKNYNAAKAWPLVVYINYDNRAGAWPYWKKSCEELGMLYCEAQNAGNICPGSRRARILLDMLDDVRRHYQIDPDQTYLTGFSGGGAMACNVGYALPEYFGGVVPICGAEPLPSLSSWAYLRHWVHDRLSVAFAADITGPKARPDFKVYWMPLFQELDIRSKLWVLPGPHGIPKPDVLTEILQWLAADLPRRRSGAKSRPSLAVGPREAPAGKQWAARQLEAARAEAKQPEQTWRAAALAQGVLARWSQSPSAEPACQFLEDLQSDPRRAALVAEQCGVEEWRAESARARARERFGLKARAWQAWQALSRKYAKAPEGKEAARQAQRLEGVVVKEVFMGISLGGNSLKISRVEENGPAAKAGVRAGDVVMKFGDDQVESGKEFTKCLQKHRPGDKVLVEMQRNGKSVTVTVQLGSHVKESSLERFLSKEW